jgi:TonB-dependent receptor
MNGKGILQIIIFIAVSTICVFAQTKNGRIEGFIKDAQTGEVVLPFATVYLEGTTIGCTSDEKGFYQINSAPSGPARLKVSFIGYQDTIINIVIPENKTLVRDVSLLFGTTLDEVVITAQAYGQVRAINNQLAATNIKNIVSEAKIRELPDANIAEALSRLPGVSINRSGGEAVDIRIRGVGANTLYVNGMPMAGGLSSIATSMIGSIELSKAFLPDQDADVLGGSVDLKMREAPSGFRKDIWLRTGYNGFTKSLKMQDFSLLLSNRFFNNKLGVMLSFNYDRKDRGKDILSAGYSPVGASVGGSDYVKQVQLNNVTLTHSQDINNRYGVTLYSDYKLKQGKVYYQGFFSSQIMHSKSATNNYTNQSSIEYTSSDGQQINRNIANGIGGEHDFLGAKIDWEINLSQSSNIIPERLQYNAFNQSGMSNLNSVDSSTSISDYISLGTHDISLTAINTIDKSKSDRFTNELGSRLDVKVPFSFGDQISGYLKGGIKYRDISRGYSFVSRYTTFRFEAYEKDLIRENLYQRTPDISWTTLPNGNFGHSALSTEPQVQDFSLTDANTYFFPDFDKVKYVTDAMYDLFGSDVRSKADDYENSEQFYAGYLMSGIELGKMITFTPGVRYEHNKHSTTARYCEEKVASPLAPYEQQANFGDTTAGSYSKYWFPMIHLKVKPLKWFDIRLSYTETVSRPGFNDMSPRYFRSLYYDVWLGNPYLKPQYNTNYDIYLSFYSRKLGLFTAGVFYKEMRDQVFAYTVRIIDPATFGLSDAYKNKNYQRMINNSKPGYIKGIEFDWQTQFSYLPGILKGVILNANLTMMQSETKYPFYSFTTVKIPTPPFVKTEGKDDFRANKIIGMPDMTGNISLGYEIGGFSGRVSMYHQSSTITAAQSGQKSIDQDKAPLTRLDFLASQKVKKVPGLMFTLSLNNITNNPDRTVLTYYHDKITRDERYGFSGDIGIRYKF